MPSTSSRSKSRTCDGLPGCGFLVCEYLIDEIMPPRITSSRSLSCGDVGRGVRAVGRERPLVLVERVAGEVEAEDFLFLLGPLAVGPFGQVGQRRRPAWRPASSSPPPKSALLPALAVGGQRLARLARPAR